MKFWKLKMNDRNYLLVSVRREHMRDVTLCSEQMQQERGVVQGTISAFRWWSMQILQICAVWRRYAVWGSGI